MVIILMIMDIMETTIPITEDLPIKEVVPMVHLETRWEIAQIILLLEIQITEILDLELIELTLVSETPSLE